jgi:hypothetical protein
LTQIPETIFGHGAQGRPKTPPRHPKGDQRGTKGGPKGTKGSQKGTKGKPKEDQREPKGKQRPPKVTQRHPQEPKRGSEGAKREPRGSQRERKGPKRTPSNTTQTQPKQHVELLMHSKRKRQRPFKLTQNNARHKNQQNFRPTQKPTKLSAWMGNPVQGRGRGKPLPQGIGERGVDGRSRET